MKHGGWGRTCMKDASASAPASGIELYTDARMPPTERCPLSWICAHNQDRSTQCCTTKSVSCNVCQLLMTRPLLPAQQPAEV